MLLSVMLFKCGTVRYFISHADHHKYNLLRNIKF
jgi:hypothetical protein